MANQRPFDDFLTQPLQTPRNPAAEAGMGGPFSGIMHAATNFISGAREARVRQMIEAERQQDKNLRAIQTMLEQLDKGGYDPDDPTVHNLRGELVAQLATQVAATDDGSKPGQPGGNPLGMFLKQAAVNLLGGQAPKKVAPITTEQVLAWRGKMSELPTLAQAQKKAREDWVTAVGQRRREAEAQEAATGVPVGKEFYTNDDRIIKATLELKRVGLEPTELGGAHQSVIGDAITNREQANTLARYQDAIKNQRDAAVIEGLRNAPDPGLDTFADFVAQKNPKALQPQGTFVVPASMQTQERLSHYVSPDERTTRSVLVYPNGIAVDAGTGAPVDIAALQAQGWKSYGTNPRFSPGSQWGIFPGSAPWDSATVVPYLVPKVPGGRAELIEGAARATPTGVPVTVGDETGRQTLITWTRPRSSTQPQGAPPAQTQQPQSSPAPVPPGAAPQQAPKAQPNALVVGGYGQPQTTATQPQKSGGVQKRPAVQIAPQVLEQYKLGQLSRKDVADTYGRDSQYFDNVLNQAAPGFRALTADQSTYINTLSDAIPLLEQFEKLHNIYKTKGPADAAAFATRYNIASQIETLRGFGGAKGVLTDRDVERLTKIQPGIASGVFYPQINEEIIKSIKETVLARLNQALAGVSDEQKAYILDRRGFRKFIGGGGPGGSRNVNLFQGN